MRNLRRVIRRIVSFVCTKVFILVFKIIGAPRVLRYGSLINVDLLERIHRFAGATGRKVMSPGDLRGLLNLQPGGGTYGRVYTQP